MKSKGNTDNINLSVSWKEENKMVFDGVYFTAEMLLWVGIYFTMKSLRRVSGNEKAVYRKEVQNRVLESEKPIRGIN
jgi:hypothetical protein